jgi:hypothetical protein
VGLRCGRKKKGRWRRGTKLKKKKMDEEEKAGGN